MGAAGKGTTQEYTFRTTVPQRKLQRTGTIRRFTTFHVCYKVLHCSSGILTGSRAQRLAVYYHHFGLPVSRQTVMMAMISLKVGTHREAKLEKSSTATFSEVTFDRISSNARSRRALISSYTLEC